MAWIRQRHEAEVHVVPDTEPGHILSVRCFCLPAVESVKGRYDGVLDMVTHRDRLQRETDQTEWRAADEILGMPR